MKYGAIASIGAGFAFGLFLTLLSHCIGGRIDQYGGLRPGGCFDRDDCPSWTFPLLIGYVLLLPMLFGILNAVAWQRWTARKWACRFVALSLFTMSLHLSGYVMPPSL